MKCWRFLNLRSNPSGKQSGSGISAVAALREIAGEEAFRRAALRTPDRRELFAAVARELACEEYVVLEKIGARLEIPIVKNVQSPDWLPEVVEFSDLRCGACLPVFENGGLSALVCVDPACIDPITSRLGTLPLRLGTWNDIRLALAQCEGHVERVRAIEAEAVSERANQLGMRALVAIVRQACNSDQTNLQIFDAGERLTYEFVVAGGQCARGFIRAEAMTALWSLLESKTAERSFMLDASESLSMKVERLSPVRYLISWSQQQAAEAAPAQFENVISFPQSSASQPERAPIEVQSHQARIGLERARVLIVDDNATFVRVLERFFDRHGLDVTHVSSASEAIDTLGSQLPPVDLVVCDVYMPGGSGKDFLKHLRQDSRFNTMPIVMLTSDGDVELKLRLLNEGADAFITKNEDPRLLCVQVQRLISMQRAREVA